MAEIDPIILRLVADNVQYLANIRNTTTVVDRLLDAQEKKVLRLETQMRRSSGQIGASLKAIAAGLVTGAAVQQVGALADGYTKFTNQLRVAGLEGDSLARTQEDLFGIAQKYGTELENVGTLYGRLAGNTKELGLSNAQLLTFVEGTSAALKVSGQSAGEASGALLQLSQALGGSKIQAEEYNSLIDGARPLLQAVANGSDKFGGSVSKLTAAVKAGKVSTQEFVQAGLKGIPALMEQAEKASLTLSASFTILNNALGKYIGQTDQTLSATQRISGAIKLLADNLDTVIPALAVIAAAIGVRYVAAIAGATVATVAKTAADVRAEIATTAMATAVARANALMLATGPAAAQAAAGVTSLSVAQGVAARGAVGLGASLSRLVGGPWGAALIALGAAVYYVYQQTHEASEATGKYAQEQADAARSTDAAAKMAEKLASAHGKARVEALALARAEAENVRQKVASARASVELAKTELARARAKTDALRATDNAAVQYGGADSSFAGLGAAFSVGLSGENRARGNIAAAENTLRQREQELKDREAAINALGTPKVGGGDPGKGKKTKGASGPSADEIASRFNDERASLMQQYNSALSSMAKSADEQAEFELRNVELARVRTAAGIKSDKDYTKAQKATLLAQLNEVAEVERNRIDFERRRELERDAQQLADAQYNSQRDQLQQQYDLTDSTAERRRLALALVDAEEAHLRATLEAVKNSMTADDAEKRAADVDLQRLNILAAGQRDKVNREHESSGQKYLRDLRSEANNLGDAYEDVAVRGLERMNDALKGSIQSALGLHGALGDIIGDFIELALRQQILGPLASALFGGGGALIGGQTGAQFSAGLGSSLNAYQSSIRIPAFATGTNFAPGGLSLVGERGPELVNLPRGSQVIPNNRLTASRGGTVVQQFHFDARNAVMTPQLLAQMQNMVTQGSIVASDTGAHRGKAMVMRSSRNRIPG